MRDYETDVQGDENVTKPHTCGVPLDLHIGDVFEGLLYIGLGSGCYDTYRALVETADWMRRVRNFPVYHPQGVVDELLNEERALQAMESGNIPTV